LPHKQGSIGAVLWSRPLRSRVEAACAGA
jgi:hypothetical protein